MNTVSILIVAPDTFRAALERADMFQRGARDVMPPAREFAAVSANAAVKAEALLNRLGFDTYAGTRNGVWFIYTEADGDNAGRALMDAAHREDAR